jgi:hypothetical protein
MDKQVIAQGKLNNELRDKYDLVKKIYAVPPSPKVAKTGLVNEADSTAATAGLTPGGATIAKAQSEYQKLLDAMKGYLRDNELARMSSYGKELAQLADKHSQEAQIIEKAFTDKEIGQEEHDAKMLELDKIYGEKSQAVLEKVNAEVQADLEARNQEEIKLATEKRLKQLTDEQTYYETMKWLDAGYYDWKLKQYEKEVAAMAISQDQKDALLKQYRESLEADMGQSNLEASNAGRKQSSWFFGQVLGFDPDNPQDQQKIEAVKGTYASIVQGTQNMVNELANLNRQRKEDELARIEATAEREKWSNDRLIEEKKKVNKKWEAEERKLRNVQKAISITQTIINTAEGVSAALKWGIPFGPIFAAVIGAMGAVQVGLIAAQKFATGGLFRGKGGQRDDQNLIAVSDHEYIVNAEATKRFLPLLNAINYGAGGSAGASVAYASGGLVMGGISLKAIEKKLDALNMNVANLELAVTVVNNAPDLKTQVERPGKGIQLWRIACIKVPRILAITWWIARRSRW